MSGNRTGCSGLLLPMLLVLPILDISLTSMLVRSILEGKPEIGLFVMFYVQIVLTEIIIRTLIRLHRRKVINGWYYWASWICRWSLILMALLSIVHIILTGSFQTLLLPDLYGSPLWTDMALIPLRWISGLCGLALLIGRKETRKKILLISLVGMPVSFFIIGLTVGILDKHPVLSDYVTNVLVLWIPRLAALGGALFDPLYGKQIREREKEEREKAEKEKKKQAAPRSLQGHPSAQVPAGQAVVSREKQLTQMKANYVLRMRSREEAEQTVEERPFEELLETTAVRLFSEGEAAASLGGQRQLVYWMIGAAPALKGLLRQPIGKAFFDPELQDDPEAFLPVLERLIEEAARLLERTDAKADDRLRERKDPEALCAGWYALTRFAAIIPGDQAFAKEAMRMKEYIRNDGTCRAWLKAMSQSDERGRADGPGEPA